MKHHEIKTDFRVGAYVHWTVGNTRKEGQIVEIYRSGKASGLSVRTNRENDRVLLIRQSDASTVMKLESDVLMKNDQA
jgi:hypothetical protein